MNIRRQNKGVALLAWVIALCILGQTKSIARDDDLYLRGEATLQLACKNAQAQKIALERYRFWHRVQSKFGYPFYTHYDVTVLLYPTRRSDRLYVLLLNTWWTPRSTEMQGTYAFLCFQEKDHNEKLVYMTRLNRNRLLSDKLTPANNLLNYLHRKGCAIKEDISKAAMNDLNKECDYTAYEYSIIIDTLYVSVLSDLKKDDAALHQEQYNITMDPLTNAKFKENSEEFYRRYGFPVASRELSKIIHGD